jgi:hypothetical protein
MAKAMKIAPMKARPMMAPATPTPALAPVDNPKLDLVEDALVSTILLPGPDAVRVVVAVGAAVLDVVVVGAGVLEVVDTCAVILK